MVFDVHDDRGVCNQPDLLNCLDQLDNLWCTWFSGEFFDTWLGVILDSQPSSYSASQPFNYNSGNQWGRLVRLKIDHIMTSDIQFSPTFMRGFIVLQKNPKPVYHFDGKCALTCTKHVARTDSHDYLRTPSRNNRLHVANNQESVVVEIVPVYRLGQFALTDTRAQWQVTPQKKHKLESVRHATAETGDLAHSSS